MKSNAFTMIELIFVIVILGLLTAVAIPKLTATRDDALVTRELSNAQTMKKEMINEYLAKDVDIAMKSTDCYSFDVTNGLLTVSKSVNNAATYCNDVYSTNAAIGIDGVQKIGGRLVNFD